MRKNLLKCILIAFCIFLTGCTAEVKDNQEIEDKNNEIDIVIDNSDTAINYSDDKNANIFIERYNELNSNNIITEDMVTCPPNSGIKLTIIEFEYMDFCISETDGSPSYRCESILEYNDENTKGFFEEVFYVIQAVEEKIPEDDIEQILLNLQEGEYPYDTYAASEITSRRFSFRAPGYSKTQTKGKTGESLSYDLYWHHATTY